MLKEKSLHPHYAVQNRFYTAFELQFASQLLLCLRTHLYCIKNVQYLAIIPGLPIVMGCKWYFAIGSMLYGMWLSRLGLQGKIPYLPSSFLPQSEKGTSLRMNSAKQRFWMAIS